MRFLFSLFIVLSVGFIQTLPAQDISSMDVRNVNVDNLTDQQIERIWQEAQRRGLSISQVEQLAVSRGMPRSEARKLVRRISEVRTGIGEEDRTVPSRFRTAGVDTTQMQQFDAFFGVETPSDSLLFYQTLEQLRKQNLRDRIFGSSLFDQRKVSFQPSLNIPTPKNYELGPGDEMIIDIWGAAQNTYQLQITPDGMIMIPDLGPIYMSGLTIEEASKRLKERLSQIYSGLAPQDEQNKDTYMQVTLGQVRSINVTVLGEVQQPGTYTVPSLATIFNALYSAGGPTTEGSFREIQLIRNNQIISTFDIYDFLVKGDQSGNVRLQDQDIIKINPYINRVEIEGEVKREGIFETRENETLADLLNFTGGFTGQAYTNRIKVIGKTDRQHRIRDVTKDRFDRYIMENGDRVTVGEVLERFENLVEIEGAVFRPGQYELTDTTTVYSLIQRADGLTEDAFMNRGLIYRKKEDLTLEAISFNIRDLINNPEQHDIPLVRDDLVRISSIFDLREDFFVEISGSVQNPDQYPYVEDMTLEDIIFQAGGFREEATPYRIEVARRIKDIEEEIPSSKIAEIFQFRVDEDLKLDAEEADFTLQPFDRVYVRRSINYEEQQEITISGEIKYPGKYSIESKDNRISDIIQRAGGLTEDAYLQGATLFRRLAKLEQLGQTLTRDQDQQQEENRQQTQGRAQQQNTDEDQPEGFLTREAVAESERERERTVAKIGIELQEILREPGSRYDLLLEEGDSLYIPKELQTVTVRGGVFYPTSIRYRPGTPFTDYVSLAGGFTDQAKKKRAYVIYANGDVDRTKKFLFFKNYPEVKPGATLVIPEKPEPRRLTPQERVSILSAIVSTAALVSTTIIQITR